MDARLALRTAEERARALHGRADSLLTAAQRRARGPRPRRRAPRAAAPRGPGRRGRRAAASRSSLAAARGVGRRGRGRARTAVEAGPPRPRGGADGGPRPAARPGHASTTSWSTPCTATRWPAPSSGCASSSSRSARSRSSASTPTPWWPTTAPTTSCRRCSAPSSRPSEADPDVDARAGAVRPRGAAEAAAVRRARAGHARQGQPARARGVHRAGGAAPVPRRAARGPAQDPPRPARHRPRGRRAGRAGVHRGVARRRARVRRDVFKRLFPGGEGRLVLTDPDDMLDHRHRGRGPPARQEGQAAVAAVRRRAVAGRGGVPGRAVQGPALAVLHPRRGRGGARRHQPRPAAGDLRGAARELASCS